MSPWRRALRTRAETQVKTRPTPTQGVAAVASARVKARVKASSASVAKDARVARVVAEVEEVEGPGDTQLVADSKREANGVRSSSSQWLSRHSSSHIPLLPLSTEPTIDTPRLPVLVNRRSSADSKDSPRQASPSSSNNINDRKGEEVASVSHRKASALSRVASVVIAALPLMKKLKLTRCLSLTSSAPSSLRRQIRAAKSRFLSGEATVRPKSAKTANSARTSGTLTALRPSS